MCFASCCAGRSTTCSLVNWENRPGCFLLHDAYCTTDCSCMHSWNIIIGVCLLFELWWVSLLWYSSCINCCWHYLVLTSWQYLAGCLLYCWSACCVASTGDDALALHTSLHLLLTLTLTYTQSSVKQHVALWIENHNSQHGQKQR